MTGAVTRRCLLPALGALAPRRYWGGAYREWRALERSQWWPAERLRDLQWRRLRALIAHAHRSVPYYRRMFAAAGAEPGDLRDFDDFARLPPLTRDALRQEGSALRAEGWERRLVPDATGGSSGRPVTFAVDDDEAPRRLGAAMRHNAWAGWRWGDRVAAVWGAPADLDSRERGRGRRVTGLIAPTSVLDAYGFTRDEMARFAQEMRRWRPRVLFGYASGLYEFARFLRETGVELPSARAAVSSADALWPAWRRAIEDALGVGVHDRYGARECGVIASECRPGGAMHVNAEHVLVEVLPDDDLRQPGAGRVLVTKLRSYGMPFLRYDIGDYGELIEGDCPCGRGLPRLRLTGARATDFLVGSDGRLVSGVAIAVALRDLSELEQVQLVQTTREQVRLRIARGAGGDAVAAARRRLGDLLGAGVELSVERVDDFARTASGKFQFTRCEIRPRAAAVEGR